MLFAFAIVVIINSRLSDCIEALKSLNPDVSFINGDGVSQGEVIHDVLGGLASLKWVTLGAVGLGFVVVYGSITLMGTRHWNTMTRRWSKLQSKNSALQTKDAESDRLLHESKIIADIGRIISSSSDIHDVYLRFAEDVRLLVPFDRIGINLIDLKTSTYRDAYVSGLTISERGAGLSLPLEGSLTGAVSASRKPTLLKLDRIDSLPEAYPGLIPVFDAGVRNSIVVPLIYNGDSIGVLILDSTQVDAYDSHHLQLAERVADQIAGAIANAQLYAERQRSEQEIKRLVRQNEMILNSAGEGIYGLDSRSNTTFANPAAAEMIGWSVEELIGRSQHSVLHHTRQNGEPYPREDCPIYRAFKDGAVHRVTDEVFWRKNGTCFPVEYVSTPIRDDQGQLVGAVVTFIDISERKELERMKDEFISVASHELRTPVTSIKGFVELLIDDDHGSFSDEQILFLDAIDRNTHRLEYLVTDLLDFSRLESSMMRVDHSEFDLRQVVEQVVSEMQVGIDAKNLAVTINGPPEPAYVEADRGHVAQVVVNLLSNAVKYSPIDSRIDVSISPLPGNDGIYQVNFRDYGPGIEPGKVEHVFRKFYRVDDPATRSISGTGLGLPIAKSLVELNGGEIWAESDLGNGSNFSFTLPRVRQSS